ncbi:FUSC family membrane protein [Paucibacter sp. APW11]|uniref:FUSC family membrane protein n=1 Tax=Roseateles aquae TaxID=3077235 RepID=A0ABU3PC09_9BURK|nr:FUSC family membrane protein [Paucibacter sp. APW11]MDT9000085.1 FUSC family membrane protein [Paucibacter sp. APW11]
MELLRRARRHHLTAAQLNGLSVSVGLALDLYLFSAVFGLHIGLAASGGAVCASLTDVPNPPRRVWPRVVPAALLAALVTLGVGLLREQPLGMPLLVAATAFIALMTLAWGPRAGPLSFAGLIALVFSMAWEAPQTRLDAVHHAGWVLAGALVYALWARFASWALRRRYRELALATAMRATAQRLRSRALRIAGELPAAEDSIRASIADDVLLADTLQAARDQVFDAQDSVHARRQVDLLLGLIELRDLLLASRLDIPLLGEDEAGWHWRRSLAETLRQLAGALQQLAEALVGDAPLPAVSAAQWRAELQQRLQARPCAAEDSRRHLLAALQGRLGHMLDDVAAMVQRCRTSDREASLTPQQLRQFVSPEGWPMAALPPHLTLASPVLRHALRGMLALSVAYQLGRWLPWAAHPHWLLLSVIVVLRGNLEQTLARRNDRISGTVIGCLVVAALGYLPGGWMTVPVLALIYVGAIGVAHAYLNVRYRVAATAATLMALLQPLMLEPGMPPPILERLADTLIGAGLAWAFCFVLPSWERRSLLRLSQQLRGALARHGANVLQWAPTSAQQLDQRLSRQQAYAALAALAGAGQRTRAEPETVRVPDAHIEALLSHAYRLMALLGAVQQLLSRRTQRLDPLDAQQALAQARQDVLAKLRDAATTPEPLPLDSDAADDWPEHRDDLSLTPWLQRRLRLCVREAGWLKTAVQRVRDAIAGPRID